MTVLARKRRKRKPGRRPVLVDYRPRCRECGREAARGRRIFRCVACGRQVCEACVQAHMCGFCFLLTTDAW